MLSISDSVVTMVDLVGRAVPRDDDDPKIRDIAIAGGRPYFVRQRYTRGDVKGLAAGCVLAIISSVASAGLLSYLAFHVSRRNNELAGRMRAFLTSDLGCYFLCLITTNLLASLGYAMTTRVLWSYLLETGVACNFQGVAKSVGALGGSIWNAAIAMQTFSTVVMRKRTPKWVLPIVLAAGWGSMLLVAIIGPIEHRIHGYQFSFYGPQTVGCWVSFMAIRRLDWFISMPVIALISMGLMIVLYIVTFMHIVGVFARNAEGNWSWYHAKSSTQNSAPSGSGPGHQPTEVAVSIQARKVARKMLLFPVIYTVTGILSIIAALLFVAGHTEAAISLDFPSFTLLPIAGTADVILFILTRHTLISPRKHQPTTGRSAVHVTTHQTTFIDLDPNDSHYELHVRPQLSSSGKQDAESFDMSGDKPSADNEDLESGVFRVKAF